MILFKQGIIKLTVHYKLESKRYFVGKKKVLVSRKLFFIPVYNNVDYVFEQTSFTGDPISPVESFRPKRLYVEDGKIYYKPHCIIHMSDKTEHTVFFEDTGSLWKYKNDLINSMPAGHIDLNVANND